MLEGCSPDENQEFRKQIAGVPITKSSAWILFLFHFPHHKIRRQGRRRHRRPKPLLQLKLQPHPVHIVVERLPQPPPQPLMIAHHGILIPYLLRAKRLFSFSQPFLIDVANRMDRKAINGIACSLKIATTPTRTNNSKFQRVHLYLTFILPER